VADINVKNIFEELLTKIYDVKSQSFTPDNYEEKRKRLVYDNSQGRATGSKETGCCQ